MKGIDLAKNIALKTNEKVKRTYWTNEKINKYFGKRSVEEILEDGETCFMNPCFDLTIVSSYFMSKENIPHKFVIEEHLPSQGFDFNRLHFVIEFESENKNYVLNYKRGNEVYIWQGKYNGRNDIPLAQILKIPGIKLNPKKPIYENFGYNNLKDFLENKFKGYSLEANLNRLKKDNSKENYENYKKIFKEELKITTNSKGFN